MKILKETEKLQNRHVPYYPSYFILFFCHIFAFTLHFSEKKRVWGIVKRHSDSGEILVFRIAFLINRSKFALCFSSYPRLPLTYTKETRSQ